MSRRSHRTPKGPAKRLGDDAEYARPRAPPAKRKTGGCPVVAAPGAAPCGNIRLPDQEYCFRHRPKTLAGAAVDFPDTPSPEQLRFLAGAWRDNFRDNRWIQLACAVCGGLHNADEITTVDTRDKPPAWLPTLAVPYDFLDFLSRDPETGVHRDELFQYGDPAFDGHMLDPAGLLIDESGAVGGLRVCKTCIGALAPVKNGGRSGRASHAPTSSLLNGLWTGPIPPELANLTPAEEIVLALSRTRHTTLFFLRAPAPDADLNTRQRAARGNWVAWPQFTDVVHDAVTQLPMSATALGDVLHVTLVGAPSQDNGVLRRALSVSRTRLKAAFDWLKRHNHLHGGIAWSEAAAASYDPDGAIPSAVEQFVWAGEDPGERDEYATQRDQGERDKRPAQSRDATETLSPEESSSDAQAGSDERSEDARTAEEEARLDAILDALKRVDASRFRAGCPSTLRDAIGDLSDDDKDYEIERSGFVDVAGGRVPVAEGRITALDRITRAERGQARSPPDDDAPHVTMGRAAGLESSYDEFIMPRLFPTLYPYGVGGFASRRGAAVMSATGLAPDLLDHIRGHLLASHRRFARHPTFLFFAFNLHHRREATHRTALKISRAGDKAIDDIGRLTLEDILALRTAVSKGTSRTNQARADLLLKYCQWVMGALVGTEHSRLHSRNHIRALITAFGLPGVWFTVSPSDQQSLLLLKLNGLDINLDLGSDQTLPSLAARRRIIADDPVQVALFFRAVLDGVLEILFGATRDGSKQGVFGRALAHYATIESGKRGYLHAHGLLWLHGQPSPAEFKTKLQSTEFQARIAEYVDRVFKQDFDGIPSYVRQARADGTVYDRTNVLADNPPTPDPAGDIAAYGQAMEEDRRAVAELVLTHKCSVACLRDGLCRYRFPHELHRDTHVDDKGIVVPRRRHPRVNGHNPVVASLTRCNSDVKLTFLAPAMLLSFIFYATKYMTKSDLAVKRTAALMAIAKQTNDKYKDDRSTKAEAARALLGRCVTRIGADAEIPATAASYYLLHGEDHFASDKFVSLQLSMALGRLRREEAQRSPTVDPDASGSDDDFGHRADFEAVALEVDQGTGQIVEHNPVEDYVHRAPELEHVPFYLFVAKYDVKPASSPRTSTNANRQFAFLPTHPRFKTHRAAERDVPVVPVIVGASIPRQNHYADAVRLRYARSVLALFKPWRSVDDLLPVGGDWDEAVQAFKPAADVQVYIDHLQLLHQMKEEADHERLSRAALGPSGRLDRDGRDERGDLEDGLRDPHEEADHDLVAGALLARPSSRDRWLTHALETLQRQGMFDPRLSHGTAGKTHCADAYIEAFDSGTARRLREWRSKLTEADAAVRERRRALPVPPDRPAETPMVLDDEDCPAGDETPDSTETVALAARSDAVDILSIDHELNPVNVARRSGLNKRQTLAFFVIVLAQLDKELGTPGVAPQVFVAGAAGAGKSVVLNTVAAWMARRGLRLTAPTGTAAAKIKGMTIHSLLGFQRPKNGGDGELDVLSEGKARLVVNQTVRDELEQVSLICCDEVGMIGHHMMSAANQVLQKVKASDAAFGGTTTVWFGDFCQFAPVGDNALYGDPTARGADPAPPNLWESALTDCIVLDEPMRQGADEVEFLKTLSDLRVGRNVRSSWELLNKRVVGGPGNAVSLSDPIFRDALFITARHALRRHVNRLRLEAHAAETGQRVLACVGRYVGRKSMTAEDLAEVGSMSPRSHGATEPILFLTVGMPVVLNSNLHTAQGVTNGAYATVTRIVLDDLDEAGLKSDTGRGEYVLSQPPKLLIVKMKVQHPDLVHLPGLSPGEVPVVPVKCTVKTKNGTFRFDQLPLSPAYAVTDYRAQGATEPAVVIDLLPPTAMPDRPDDEPDRKATRSTADARAASYVSISRVTTLDGLAVLRSFKPHHLGAGVKPDVERQLARKQRLQAGTVERLKQRLHALGWASKHEEYIVGERGYSQAY
ncbi:hypothetical protein JCM10213_000426 [Rhodosporidiobolus nylandii]